MKEFAASQPPANLPPCVIFEDEHLVVVNKPAGWNTHAPSPFAGEGIYDWFKHREPRWANLAILHRLDKETSGVMIFGKTALANRSLTEQFTKRTVRKTYVLLTDHAMPGGEIIVKSKLARAGERYMSGARGDLAETRFRLLDSAFRVPRSALVEVTPLTGRTHQSVSTRRSAAFRFSATRFTAARRSLASVCTRRNSASGIQPPMRKRRSARRRISRRTRDRPCAPPSLSRRRRTRFACFTAQATAGPVGTWIGWALAGCRKAKRR